MSVAFLPSFVPGLVSFHTYRVRDAVHAGVYWRNGEDGKGWHGVYISYANLSDYVLF